MCQVNNRQWIIKHQYLAVNYFNDVLLKPLTSTLDAHIMNHKNVLHDTCEFINEFIASPSNSYNDLEHDIQNKLLYLFLRSQQDFTLFEERPSHISEQYITHATFRESSISNTHYASMFETMFHLQATQLCLSTRHQ